MECLDGLRGKKTCFEYKMFQLKQFVFSINKAK